MLGGFESGILSEDLKGRSISRIPFSHQEAAQQNTIGGTPVFKKVAAQASGVIPPLSERKNEVLSLVEEIQRTAFRREHRMKRAAQDGGQSLITEKRKGKS